MGGAMGMDSPQAQKDPFAITLCILFLTFPIITFLCGMSLPILNHFNLNKTALIIGLLPIIEATIVIFSIYVFGDNP
jgi:hypothetical protein